MENRNILDKFKMQKSKLLASLRSGQLKSQNLILPAIIIVFAVLMRLAPHPPNISPVAAMALFGGVYLPKKYALTLPLLVMVISDTVLGVHEGSLLVYTSFFLIGFLGIWLRGNRSVPAVLVVSLSASVVFFLITNCNYLHPVALYPKTVSGMVESYVNALPFFRNTLLGDLMYTVLFFGSYEGVTFFLKRSLPARTK